MKRPGFVIGGIVLVLLGILWTLQGLGRVGGSVMSGVTFWAVVGPIVALVGLGLVVTGWRSGRPDGGSRP
ncbi:MAG: hypothetical protein ABIW80_02130 [Lapillicoccus sp.]